MASDANLQKQNSRESKLKTLFVILTLIAFPMTVFGQSAFLEKGQSGLGLVLTFLPIKMRQDLEEVLVIHSPGYLISEFQFIIQISRMDLGEKT